jgi:tryptophanyl-tRNA synthetase
VSNLLEIVGVLTDRAPEVVAQAYSQYGPLKTDAGEAVIELTRPFRERVTEYSRDLGSVAALLAKGAAKAREVASVTVARAERNVGLLPPG